jgi:hypothetical protein
MSDASNDRASAPRPKRWRQFSLRGLLLIVLVLALLFWWLRPEVLDRGYFPIGVGYRWTYASMGGDTQDDVVFEVVGVEQIGDADCYVVVRTIGEHQLKFYVEVNGRGVSIHQVDDDRYQPPFQQFVFPTKQGDRWSWKGAIGKEKSEYDSENVGLQQVQTPLGQWEAFCVQQRSQAMTNFWLVDEIGVVRLEGKSWDEHDPAPQPGGPLYFDWQLKDFSRP